MKLSVLFALCIILVPVNADAATRDPMTHFFHQGFGDLSEEKQLAKSGKKTGVLLMFDNAECPWCAKMKTTVLNQSDVQDYFRRHFRIVSVDTEGDTPLTDFDGREMLQKDFAFRKHRVRATPVFKFFDVNGREIYKHTGVVRNKSEFMLLGEFIVNGHYRNKRFSVYKREKRGSR